MQPYNLAEYKLIREEMLSLENCITNYASMAFPGNACLCS